MAATLQFSGVNCGRITGLSFTLAAAEVRVLALLGKDEKSTAIDLAVGELIPEQGSIMLAGKALDAVPPGAIGWVPDNGGLIGNLKIWENITLPLWYHGRRRPGEAEESIARWLPALGVQGEAMASFMASSPGLLSTLERKRAGLLRGLVLAPQALVVDGALFSNLPQDTRASWIAALDSLASGTENSSVLVVTQENDIALPWPTIGQMT